MDVLVSASQCTKLLTWAQVPHLGFTFSAPLLIQSTSVAAPLLVPGSSFPPITREPVTMQGPAFRPIPSGPIVFSGALGVPGSMQSTGAPQSTAIAKWLERRDPVRPRLMLVHLWPLQPGQCICLVIYA